MAGDRMHVLSRMLMMGMVCGLLGCSQMDAPRRNVDFKNVRTAIASYLDYKHLEKKGVETVEVSSPFFTRKVSLAFYLFTIAQAMESFGRDQDAVKLYLRMLTHYPLLQDGSQLSVLVENRIYWILGDKTWIVPTASELSRRIAYALVHKDTRTLEKLISRDFGFGRTYQDRYAVKYRDGIQLIANEFQDAKRLKIEMIGNAPSGEVIVKSSGWDRGSKTWFFALHKNPRHQGWEWDLAYSEPVRAF